MSAATTAIEEPRAAAPVRVHVPPHSLASELRAIQIVWRRDLITSALGLSAALVFVLSAASAVALGLAGR